MARAPTHPERVLFSTEAYMNSWAASNMFYAQFIAAGSSPSQWIEDKYADFRIPTQNPQAALKSGIVDRGGYVNIIPKSGPAAGLRASPNYAASQTNFNYLGARKKQKPDLGVGWVAMGGYAFPGQAFTPVRNPKTGGFGPNALSLFMVGHGMMGNGSGLLSRAPDPTGVRARKTPGKKYDRGWTSTLDYAINGGQRGEGGIGHSSVDTTNEMYATKETASGANMYDTDEQMGPNGSWTRLYAGFKRLAPHSQNQNYITDLGNMYKKGTNQDSTDTADRVRNQLFL